MLICGKKVAHWVICIFKFSRHWLFKIGIIFTCENKHYSSHMYSSHALWRVHMFYWTYEYSIQFLNMFGFSTCGICEMVCNVNKSLKTMLKGLKASYHVSFLQIFLSFFQQNKKKNICRCSGSEKKKSILLFHILPHIISPYH